MAPTCSVQMVGAGPVRKFKSACGAKRPRPPEWGRYETGLPADKTKCAPPREKTRSGYRLKSDLGRAKCEWPVTLVRRSPTNGTRFAQAQVRISHCVNIEHIQW